MRLEDLQPNASLRGILPDATVTVVSVEWHGSDALTLVYRGLNDRVADEILYRHDEPRIEIVEAGFPWSFDGDGALFRLVSEAHRIRLAHLFDPVLAVHTSLVDPLPHQITAVYEAILPRQPLRFLLADDPGAGKTIMAGLLIKELIARGDLRRCLIVCPGNLAEQWQDELHRRFHLPVMFASATRARGPGSHRRRFVHCFDEGHAETGQILIPQGETSGRVVHQVQDFKDEWDQYQEREAAEEEALMQTFILAHRSETPAAMLAEVLKRSPADPKNKRMSFARSRVSGQRCCWRPSDRRPRSR
jgi:hypothetical protein